MVCIRIVGVNNRLLRGSMVAGQKGKKADENGLHIVEIGLIKMQVRQI